ncbi:MAG: TIGR02646 family protein [Verrucomicrobia bacterium]|nr:TIGR02646 family protein [Verrucomicrobiota bacterium]
MKLCLKLPEPPTLTLYRAANPEATWDEMRDDPFHGGQKAARDVKRTLIRGQRCLCAFCECRLAEDCSDAAIDTRSSHQRVEHFHPKADTNRPPNWNLHWPNLWAVCLGGTTSPNNPKRNLHCDAHKDRQITCGALPSSPEGWILSPDQVPAFPSLFGFAPDGTPEPHSANCAAFTVTNNHYSTTAKLVEETIVHLNLGNFDLNERRRIAKARLQKRIESDRKLSPGAPAASVMLTLARRLFASDPASPWNEFFTLIRFQMGDVAEQHLLAIQFKG